MRRGKVSWKQLGKCKRNGMFNWKAIMNRRNSLKNTIIKREYAKNQQQRFDRIATTLWSSQIDVKICVVQWLKHQCRRWYEKMRFRIAQSETKLRNWQMKRKHNLLQAFQGLMMIVNECIEELKFATKWGAKEHEIIEVPRLMSFNMFLNATKRPSRG